MFYIFEDRKTSDTAFIFNKGYPSNVVENFIYSSGAPNISNEIDILLKKESKPDFIIFMDLIPGNRSIQGNYMRLVKKIRALEQANKCRGIIIPIICAEYYIVKALVKQGILINNQSTKLCVDKGIYTQSSILQENDALMNYCKSFEKYCKKVLEFQGIHKCSTPSNKDKREEGLYYKYDCTSSCILYDSPIRLKNNLKCNIISLVEKASYILKEYPIIPKGSLVFSINDIENYDEIINIHRRLVDEFNEWDNFYMQNSYLGVNGGTKINYMK